MAEKGEIEGVCRGIEITSRGVTEWSEPLGKSGKFLKKIKKIKNKMKMKMKKMKNLEGDKHPLWNTFIRGGGVPPLLHKWLIVSVLSLY